MVVGVLYVETLMLKVIVLMLVNRLVPIIPTFCEDEGVTKQD